MKTIVITAEQMKVINEYLKGEIGMFTATEHQRNILTGLIDEARALMDELDAYDELDDDLIKWYWDKYNSQKEE